MKYISNTNLIKLLEVLKEDYDVYVPVKKGEQRFYKKYEDNCRNLAIGEVRVFEPLKAFFLHSRQKVAVGFNPEVPRTSAKPPAIFGVKACDLKGFKVQDHVFKNHDFEDPFYVKARNENLIISADCTCAIETCFCLALGIKPYPQEDFDINLSQIKGGYLVKVHSDKGKRFLKQMKIYLKTQTKCRQARVMNKDKELALKYKIILRKTKSRMRIRWAELLRRILNQKSGKTRQRPA